MRLELGLGRVVVHAFWQAERDHLHPYAVAYRQHVGHVFDTMLRDVRDRHQAMLGVALELDERAELAHIHDAALVNRIEVRQ